MIHRFKSQVNLIHMWSFNVVPIDANLTDCYNNSQSNGLLIKRRRAFLRKAKKKQQLSILISSYQNSKRLSIATVWWQWIYRANFHRIAGVDFSQLNVIMLIILMKVHLLEIYECVCTVEYCAIAIHWKKCTSPIKLD